MSAAWVRVFKGMIDRKTCSLQTLAGAQAKGALTAAEYTECVEYYYVANPGERPPVTPGGDGEETPGGEVDETSGSGDSGTNS